MRKYQTLPKILISIHALLAESDWYNLHTTRGLEISIHALLAESDHKRPPPVKDLRNFYPRSPCGERPDCVRGAYHS